MGERDGLHRSQGGVIYAPRGHARGRGHHTAAGGRGGALPQALARGRGALPGAGAAAGDEAGRGGGQWRRRRNGGGRGVCGGAGPGGALPLGSGGAAAHDRGRGHNLQRLLIAVPRLRALLAVSAPQRDGGRRGGVRRRSRAGARLLRCARASTGVLPDAADGAVRACAVRHCSGGVPHLRAGPGGGGGARVRRGHAVERAGEEKGAGWSGVACGD